MKHKARDLDLARVDAGTILDSLADGAYVTDTDRNILFWNAAAEAMTGWTRGDVEGRSCRDNILVHIDKDGHPLCGYEHCPLHRSIATGERSAGPLLVYAQKKTGDRMPVEVSVAPIRDPAGRVIGGIETFRDMSGFVGELDRARTIQQHACSAGQPADPRVRVAVRYTPTDMLGGDFYRVEDLGAGRVAVFLADVSGHGVASALYAMQLRSLWEEFRGLVGHPPELLAAFNRRLHVLCAGDDFFATAVHVVIDAASGRAEWVAAGHPPPFLVRADGVAQLAEAGAALGLFPEAEYHASQRVVEPGETLLLCTDGAIEVFDAEGRELEESGLMRLLSGRDYARGDAVLAAVEEDLLKVCGHVRLADDLTLIAIHLAARSGGGP